MKNELVCGLCHVIFEVKDIRNPFGDKVICSPCLQTQSELGNLCPACKSVLDADQEEVGLVLTRSDAPHRKILNEPAAMVIVCPHCRVLFFDAFQYGVLQGFKAAGVRMSLR